MPSLIPDDLFVSVQMRTPKPQHLDALIFQKRITGSIIDLIFRQAMLKTIHLDIQFCTVTKEIQDIGSERMLAAKFVFGKTPVAQPGPHQPLTPGFTQAQIAGDASCSWCLLQHCRFTSLPRSPSPWSSPAGRGDSKLRSQLSSVCLESSDFRTSKRRRTILPFPF